MVKGFHFYIFGWISPPSLAKSPDLNLRAVFFCTVLLCASPYRCNIIFSSGTSTQMKVLHSQYLFRWYPTTRKTTRTVIGATLDDQVIFLSVPGT